MAHAQEAEATEEPVAEDAAATAEEEIVSEDEIASSSYQTAFDKARKAWTPFEDASLTSEEIDDDILYVLGNVANTMFHEFAHALVSELAIVVLGKEEDAVDGFANMIMASNESDPALDKMIVAVAEDYFASGNFADEASDVSYAYDEHSLNAQRAFNVICLLVGAKPEQFKSAADNAGMPPERQDSCANDYADTLANWDTVLTPHYLNDGEAPKAKITITYGKPAEGQEGIAAMLKASGIVESVTKEITEWIRMPNNIAVAIEACGEENAFWSPSNLKLTICYELASGYMDRALTQGQVAEGEEAAPAGGGESEAVEEDFEAAEEGVEEETEEPAEAAR
ncbi:DUF4344 domain-containing metallopeptidase [Phenylobacterium sp.]|uniref:DUF4344 domain-containing metallopeptidase n=1 Tax=Phenylobacterium sp. TaxID=1871053 RepID=UPI00286BEB55|nr:DUF4344 domain-containing metallopeptidase [Phenylobacterium sp.]